MYFILGLCFVLLGKPSKWIEDELKLYDLERMPDDEKSTIKVSLVAISIITWPSFLSAENNTEYSSWEPPWTPPWANWKWLAELKRTYPVSEPLSALVDEKLSLEKETKNKKLNLDEIKWQGFELKKIDWKEFESNGIKLEKISKKKSENKKLYLDELAIEKIEEKRSEHKELIATDVKDEQTKRFEQFINSTVEQAKQEAINQAAEQTKTQDAFCNNSFTPEIIIATQPVIFPENNLDDILYKSDPTQEIQAILQNRKIEYLVHFTKMSNLQNILVNGLIARDKIDDGSYFAFVNDPLRLDNHRDTISMSVSFPNYKMFFKYRKMSSDNWVVLLFDAKLLLLKKVYYCKHNAADRRIRGQKVEALMGAHAFSGMFDEIENMQSRQEQNLRINDPTDPQAEILVVGAIEPSYIRHICFEKHNYDECMWFKLAYPHFSAMMHLNRKSMFSNRPYMLAKFNKPESYFY